jgi:hypothetical protein
MKKKLLISFSILTCYLIALLPQEQMHGNTSGGPAGYAGSPFDSNGRTCGSGGGCHGGGTTDQPSIIATNIPACGYTPGQTYNITVTATSPNRTKFGFSLSAQKTSNGVTAGILIAGTGTQLNGSNRYITHTSAGTAATAAGTRVWNFQWTAPAAGTGSVSLYAAVNCTNSSNSSSGDIIFNTSIAIQEGGLPAAPIVSAVGSTNICTGQSVTLNSNTATGINWSTGATSQSINVNTAGSFTATATNACGTSPNSNTIVVSITNPPAAPVISAVGSTNICAGQSVTLNSNTATGITWSTGPSTQSINVNTSGNYTATATNSCGSATSNLINVTITNPPVAPEVTVGATGLQFCEGQSTTLTASSSLPVVWTPGNFTTEQISVNTAGTYTASSTNNCGTTSSLPVEITVDPLPIVPNITINGNTAFCIGDSVTLTTDAQFSYSWSNETTQPNITVFSSGEFFVSVANECGIAYSDTILVAVDSIPLTPEIILNGEGHLQSSISAPFYKWFFNNNPLNTNDSILIPAEQGEYTLILASNSGCFSDTSASFSYNTTNLNNSNISNFNFYPNPVQQNQWITFRNSIPQNSEIQIFDLQGRCVYNVKLSQSSIQVPLQSGTYILFYNTSPTKLIVIR